MAALPSLGTVFLPGQDGRELGAEAHSFELCRAVFEQITLAGEERELGLAGLALELVAVADPAAGDFEVMQSASRARGNDWAVVAHHFEVGAVAATRAVAGGLVAHLGVFGDEPHSRRSARSREVGAKAYSVRQAPQHTTQKPNGWISSPRSKSLWMPSPCPAAGAGKLVATV